ncbi:MAG TPA: alcohol dehydrogenase catalytic domain-containing protein [Acidimicrobiales bacterium]
MTSQTLSAPRKEASTPKEDSGASGTGAAIHPQYPTGADLGPRIHARGWVRHYAGLLGRRGAVASQVALERDAGRRLHRVAEAAARGAGPLTRSGRAAANHPRMRSLMAAPGGRLRWREVLSPLPPGPLAAVVRPVAVATCDLDRATMLGATPLPLPLHFGHECVAEVMTVGDEVTSVRPGQRVVVPFQINCGSCLACLAGHTGNCTTVPPISMYGFGLSGGLWGGAVADQLAVPFADAMLVPLPDGIDPVAAASVADNVSDAFRHIAPHLPSLLEADPDVEVLILAGLERQPLFTPSVPLYAGLVARAMGARQVTVVDGRAPVRELADRLGLRALAPAELHRAAAAPLTVEVSGMASGLRLALSHTAPDGICTSAGSLHHSVRIPQLKCYGHNVTLHIGRSHARALIPGVLDLMVSGQLHPESVTTSIASFEDAESALHDHCRANAVKTILVA